MAHSIPFDNSFAKLGEQFFTHLSPSQVANPSMIQANATLAKMLGIKEDYLTSEEAVQELSGNTVPYAAAPLASVYAGHQFGQWNPQLGDGRAILLGEVLANNGHRFDIQLKGSGPTPYSRMGDGRSPLGPVLREYLISEAMFALGVPTTRALAAVATGEKVVRQTLEPGAILTRVASSHIRVGTFQYFAMREQWDQVNQLADYVIDRHYPEVKDSANPYLGLLQIVIRKQCQLIAQWQSIGFIHGVMNTDNMLIAGETVDYGPCAFMDNFDPKTVYSSIDHGGRYAYCNQPTIGQWNLAWLAQSLMPLLHEQAEAALELAKAAVDDFWPEYHLAYQQLFARKIGFATATEETSELVNSLLNIMAEEDLDFTLTFRRLAKALETEASDVSQELMSWIQRWRQSLSNADEQPLQQVAAAMEQVNPAVIPRNHLVEEAIQAAYQHQDNRYQKFYELLEALQTPFTEDSRFMHPPETEQVVEHTFCGT